MSDAEVQKQIERGFSQFMHVAFPTVINENIQYRESRKIWLAAITWMATETGGKRTNDIIQMGLVASQHAMEIVNLKGRN